MFRGLSTRRVVAALIAGLLTSALVTVAAAPKPSEARSPGLVEVLLRFDAVQRSIHTLSAEFVETTENKLLKNPLVAQGRFYLTKPSAVLWEYTTPEEMRYLIVNDEYIGYFPERKRAERRDIRRWSEQIFGIFGLGRGSDELGKFYRIRLEDPSPEMKGSYLLLLEPKKSRVRRKVELVRLWVDAGTLLPLKLEQLGRDGYDRVVRFRNFSVNPDLSAILYTVKIPSDFKVTTGFSGLGARPEDQEEAARR